VVPSENVFKAMDIQADALWSSTFDADELKREIEVVLQENSRKLDNPSAVAAEKLYATAFEQHRMKRWRIGTVEGLRALTATTSSRISPATTGRPTSSHGSWPDRPRTRVG
jgi:zinc protease